MRKSFTLIVLCGAILFSTGFVYAEAPAISPNAVTGPDQKALSELASKRGDLLAIVDYKEKATLWIGIITVLFPIVVAFLGWFGFKEFNVVKTLALQAKAATEEIESLKDIALLRLNIEDYNRLAVREGEYTKQDHANLRLKAKKLVQDYLRTCKNNGAIDISDMDTFYVNALADAYYETNNLSKAKELLDRSFAKDPYNPETNYKISFVCEALSCTVQNEFDKKRFLEERLQHAKKAVEYDPFNAVYIVDLALANIQLDLFDEAVILFDRAVSIDIRKTENYIAEFKDDYPGFFAGEQWKGLLKKLSI